MLAKPAPCRRRPAAKWRAAKPVALRRRRQRPIANMCGAGNIQGRPALDIVDPDTLTAGGISARRRAYAGGLTPERSPLPPVLYFRELTVHALRRAAARHSHPPPPPPEVPSAHHAATPGLLTSLVPPSSPPHVRRMKTLSRWALHRPHRPLQATCTTAVADGALFVKRYARSSRRNLATPVFEPARPSMRPSSPRPCWSTGRSRPRRDCARSRHAGLAAATINPTAGRQSITSGRPLQPSEKPAR